MKRNSLILLLWGLSTALMVASLFLIFVYVPTEETMGIVQRIFYFHVPMAWAALLSYIVLFVASVGYLRTRQKKWDVIAHSAGVVGIVLTSAFLMLGILWAKPVWGVWWTWDPRLTTALILWFIYLGYLMVRSFASDEDRGARFAAVVGIIGFVDLPMIALSNTLWRAQHPTDLIFQGGLTPPMLLTFMVTLASFTCFYFLLLSQTVSIKNSELEIKRLRNLTGTGED